MLAEVAAGKRVTFKFQDSSSEKIALPFTRYTAKNLEQSLQDNRIVYLQLFDHDLETYLDYTIIFCNVHKKHQFLELINLDEVNSKEIAGGDSQAMLKQLIVSEEA